MKINKFVYSVSAVGCIILFSFCGKYTLPVSGSASKLNTAIDNNAGRANASQAFDDSEYFYALRKAELQLRKIVEFHKISEPKPNPELGESDPKRLIFIHIDALNSELVRLKNQPIQRPVAQPRSNQEQKLRTEVKELTERLEIQDQEVRSLKEQIQKLNEQIAKNAAVPALQPPPIREVVHRCKVQLKKSQRCVKDIQIKGEVITFNFKFRIEDIKTQHPRNSFSLENNKKITYLTILNPQTFWSISSELIVWGTKDYHGCMDKDYRKK